VKDKVEDKVELKKLFAPTIAILPLIPIISSQIDRNFADNNCPY